MPELDGSNVEKALFTRFVRSERAIYFGDDPQVLHTTLKSKYLKGKQVDDAGFLIPEGGRLVAEGGSSSLSIAADNSGRDETDEILANLPPIK